VDLSRVAIGIRTFLRDDKIRRALAGIQTTMSEAKIIVADCGENTNRKEVMYQSLIKDGHTIIRLPYDAGFGAMTNTLIDALDRDFLLIASDDFDFAPSYVRQGIEKMQEVLDTTDVDIAAGRVKQHGAYEFSLEDRGDTVIEHRIDTNVTPTPWYIDVDLSVNYCLFKRRVFEKVRWEPDVKIQGGEHGAQFIKIKRAGFKVAFVPGAEIAEQEGEDSLEYKKMRSRHTDPPRVCFDRIGVKRYVLGSGQVDYDAR
jgi:hypothetical protein